MDYRREIDGLRALAVLPVILFHAGFEAFSGGFVGVDVFFVISGYLITTIILTELEQGKFSIVNFYERRARRILPALFLVMLVCIPFAWFWLLPSDMKVFSQSLVAVSVFASNILFWLQTGYFDKAAELKPLLHTWSLAVEEQYYVLFPLFLMLFWKLGKRWILVTLGLIFVASLAVAQWGAYAKPTAAFFLLPTRVWELLIGAFASFYLSQTNRKDFGKGLSEVAGWFGVALIMYAVFAYSKATPFPGFYALVPTMGAVLIILFATQQTTVGKFVGNKVFVGVGLISYSAYLWHQPLFAFARERSLTEPSGMVFLILSIGALILAYFTWRYVESPFRSKDNFKRRTVFKLSLVFSIVFVSLGISGHFGLFSPNESLPEDFMIQFSWNKLRTSCDDGMDPKVGEVPFCRLGASGISKPVAAVFGDSHSEALNPVFDKLGKELNFSYVHNGLGGCLPLVGIDVVKGNWDKEICKSLADKQIKFVKDNDIKTVFLIGRWSLYTQGEYEKNMTKFFLTKSEGTELSREASRKVFTEAFLKTLSKYEELGVNVVIVLQVPQQKFDPKKFYSKLLASDLIGSNDSSVGVRELSVGYAEHLLLQQFNRQFFDTLKDRANVKLFNPDPYFCHDSRCFLGNSESSYYCDDNHINSAGSFLLEEGLSVFFK
jgi:peptidoglycan/LPS O-acetylase OafA/YrhL